VVVEEARQRRLETTKHLRWLRRSFYDRLETTKYLRWLRRSFYDRLETDIPNGGFETGARAPSSTTKYLRWLRRSFYDRLETTKCLGG
jgi:hypothetical protein